MMNLRKLNITEMLMIGCFLVVFSVWAYAGAFSRYIADDYCTASILKTKGFLGSISSWYYTWAGQYTNWTIKGFIHLIGPATASVLPTIILFGWLGVLAWTFYPIFKTLRLAKPYFIAILFASLVIFAVFAGIPNIIQSLYWIAASVPYTFPLIVFTFYVGWFIRFLQRHQDIPMPRYPILLTGLLAFVMGGLSEVYTLFQLTMFGVAAIAFYVFAPLNLKRKALPSLIIGFVCSIIPLLILIAAPGTAVRQAEYVNQRLPIVEVISRTLLVSFSYIAVSIGIYSPIPVVVTLVFSGIVGHRYQPKHLAISMKRVLQFMVLSLVLLFIVVVLCVGPHIYATAYAPSGRVYIVPHFWMMLTCLSWGLLMGMSIPYNANVKPHLKWIPKIIIGGLLIGGPLLFAGRMLINIPNFQAFASEYDNQEQQIYAALTRGERNIEIVMLETDLSRMAALDPLGMNKDKFVNRCAALYYGANTIVGRTPLQMADKTG